MKKNSYSAVRLERPIQLPQVSALIVKGGALVLVAWAAIYLVIVPILTLALRLH